MKFLKVESKTDEYENFRTGLSFVEVWEMLKIEKMEGKRSQITRHTVLGRWHEIKLRMFGEWQDYCDQFAFDSKRQIKSDCLENIG